jgi:hypothetical protein
VQLSANATDIETVLLELQDLREAESLPRASGAVCAIWRFGVWLGVPGHGMAFQRMGW